jgi:hypothetical protein
MENQKQPESDTIPKLEPGVSGEEPREEQPPKPALISAGFLNKPRPSGKRVTILEIKEDEVGLVDTRNSIPMPASDPMPKEGERPHVDGVPDIITPHEERIKQVVQQYMKTNKFEKLGFIPGSLDGMFHDNNKYLFSPFLLQPHMSCTLMLTTLGQQLIPFRPICYAYLLGMYATVINMMYELFDPDFKMVDAAWRAEARKHRELAEALWMADEERDCEEMYDVLNDPNVTRLQIVQVYERRICMGFAIMKVVNHVMSKREKPDEKFDLEPLKLIVKEEWLRTVHAHITLYLMPYPVECARMDGFRECEDRNVRFNKGLEKLKEEQRLKALAEVEKSIGKIPELVKETQPTTPIFVKPTVDTVYAIPQTPDRTVPTIEQPVYPPGPIKERLLEEANVILSQMKFDPTIVDVPVSDQEHVAESLTSIVHVEPSERSKTELALEFWNNVNIVGLTSRVTENETLPPKQEMEEQKTEEPTSPLPALKERNDDLDAPRKHIPSRSIRMNLGPFRMPEMDQYPERSNYMSTVAKDFKDQLDFQQKQAMAEVENAIGKVPRKQEEAKRTPTTPPTVSSDVPAEPDGREEFQKDLRHIMSAAQQQWYMETMKNMTDPAHNKVSLNEIPGVEILDAVNFAPHPNASRQDASRQDDAA